MRGPTTFESVQQALYKAQDMVRGTMDPQSGDHLALALLLCKHLHDEYGVWPSGWSRLARSGEPPTGDQLGAGFEHLARDLSAQQWMDKVGVHYTEAFAWFIEDVSHSVKRLPRRLPSDLFDVFRELSLDFESLTHRSLLGEAVESLLERRSDASKYAGDFHTPREVVRLMTELARPRAGLRICDPFCGTGGMLVQAKEYVEEEEQDQRLPLLHGQDLNAGAYALAAVNLYFHGAAVGALQRVDALTDGHVPPDGFDMVLSRPPSGLRLRPEQAIALSPGLPYGPVSERGAADSALLQYMLGLVSERRGTVCTVMTHGFLLRGSFEERAVRTALLDADVIEAVIGLPPDLMHSTSVPTCVLVLRAPGGKAPDRRGKVLFVDASREFRKGRGLNVLGGEHRARITAAFRSYQDVEGFARVLDRSRLAAGGDNLTVRRYVDSTPPPEPQDIRAHMVGGMPVAEIDAEATLLRSYRISASRLLLPREPDAPYMDFPSPGQRFDEESLVELARPQETRFRAAFEDWWACAETEIAGALSDGPATGTPLSLSGLARLKSDLTSTFRTRLLEPELLPEHVVIGAFAEWWIEARPVLRARAGKGGEVPPETSSTSLKEKLANRLESAVARRRRELVDACRRWERKYGLSFRQIEAQLTGTPEAVVLHNPWSEQSAWEIGADDGGTAARRRLTAARIYELIDTEKTVRAALAKLDVDEQLVLLPLLTDPSIEPDRQTERHPLRDVVTIARRGTSSQFGEEAKGVPVVEARNLVEHGLDLAGLRHLRADSAPRPADLLRSGDVLVTGRFMAGRGHRAVVWREQLPVAACGSNVLRLVPDTALLHPEYLKAWLSQPSVRPRIEARARFTQRDLYDLSAGRLLDVEIDLPSPPVQQRIAEEMAMLEKQRPLRFAQLAKLGLIKETLMADLRSARTSVSYQD
jgi:hypothetical protein